MLPLFVCSVGVLCSIQITLINLYLIFKFRHKEHEMALFYYRFQLDVLVGVVTVAYLAHLLTAYVIPDVFAASRTMVLWFGLASSNLSMARMMLALCISADRVAAAFFPIKYRVHRPSVPTLPFFLFSILTGLLQDYIFFYCCDFVIYIPPNCLALGCVMNVCFKTFWSTYQTAVLSLIMVCSVAFCARLFWWSHTSPRNRLSHANRLAILDAVTTFIFQFIPPFCVNQWPDFILFNFQFAGPFNLVGKLVGSTIEAFVMLRVLRKTHQKVTSNTEHVFSHVQHSHSETQTRTNKH